MEDCSYSLACNCLFNYKKNLAVVIEPYQSPMLVDQTLDYCHVQYTEWQNSEYNVLRVCSLVLYV